MNENRDDLPQNTEAELEAFEATCRVLSGFDDSLSFEYVDGFLAAVAATAFMPTIDVAIEAMCGDAFDRAFADPQDRTQALKSLQARLDVLRRALDPDAIIDDPQTIRFDPLVAEWTDEDRQQLVESGEASAEEAQRVQVGLFWAQGVLDGIEKLADAWAEPPTDDAEVAFDTWLSQILVLTLDPASEAMRAHLALYWPARPGGGESTPPTRDELLAEACGALQELRLYGVDFPPMPATRRVEAKVGRNDPCPCGSGRKFKKCHGANS